MNIQFPFSWKTKLTLIIVMTLVGLTLVSGSAFFGLKNVNGSVRKQNSVVEYEVLAISLAYQLLALESSSAELTKAEVPRYKETLNAFPKLASDMLNEAKSFSYPELVTSSTALSENATSYLKFREQWLLIVSKLGFMSSDGELKNLEDKLSLVEKISFSMIESDVANLSKGQRRYVASKNSGDYGSVNQALTQLEKKVKELNWETNKVGQAIQSYRVAFTGVSDLVEQEKALLESMAPVVEQLNITIDKQKKFIKDVVSSQVIKQADDERAMATTVIFLVVALVGVMILISLGGIAKQLYTQLNEMQHFLRRLAEGDFSQKLLLNNNENDEFTQLRSANNQMTEDVSSVVSQVVQGNKLLLNLRKELELAVEHLSDNSVEIEEKTQQSTVATQQISTAVNDVAKRSAHVNQKSQSAFALTKEGGTVIGDCVVSMTDIVKLIENTHKEVANLMQSSSKMLGIIDVINGLADQTNLLALNAAIESARAGEAGRGFSVVADEVRALAQKTVNATSSIGAIVNGFNDQSERMGKLMEQGIKLASSGQKNANNAMSSFERIENDIQTVAAEMDQVVVAVEEISYNTNDIAAQVGKICQQTEGSKKIRLTLEEYTHELSSQVETLENITGRFKLQQQA